MIMARHTVRILAVLAVLAAVQMVLAQDDKRPDPRDRRSRDSAVQSDRQGQRPDRPMPPGRGPSGQGSGSGQGYGRGPGGPGMGGGIGGGMGRGGFGSGGGQDSAGRGDMAQGFEQYLAQKQQDHKKSIAELEAIKKSALNENAKKTAALVEKLIDKANKEFKTSIEQMKQRSEQMRERFQGQQGQRPEPGSQGDRGQRPGAGTQGQREPRPPAPQSGDRDSRPDARQRGDRPQGRQQR